MAPSFVILTLISSHLIPYQPHTYIMIVVLTEPHSFGLVVGLPLGVLLAVAFLITTVAVVIAVCVHLSRKKEKTPAHEVEYEAVGPPQQPRGPDHIATGINVAYATSQYSTRQYQFLILHEMHPVNLPPSRHVFQVYRYYVSCAAFK